MHDEQQRVLIAIDAHFGHIEPVARRLALAPQRPARSRPEMRLTGGARPLDRLGVHMRDHQQRARIRIDDDRGDETRGIEARQETVGAVPLLLHARGFTAPMAVLSPLASRLSSKSPNWGGDIWPRRSYMRGSCRPQHI